MNRLVLLGLLIVLGSAGRLPSPVCRVSPLPSVIPVSIGETVQFDMEALFDGYNLAFEGIKKDHISISPKYTVNQTDFPSSRNFTTAKIKDHNRFLGLIARDHYTELAIGINHPESGIEITYTLQIEDHPELHCFDVDEIVQRQNNKAYAIIDCGSYHMGELTKNQFLFVDLDSKKLILGNRMNDVFVRYNHLIKRRIEVITDPFSRIDYLLRFYTVDGVDSGHSDQTYVQIFMHTSNIMKIQLLDIIDHTLFDTPGLSILDFQVHFNLLYLLVRDRGLYQFQFTPTQRIIRKAFFPIKMNVQRFFVEQNGFNDDLHLIISNGNTVYQYEWDVTSQPVLITKYNLMGGTTIEDLIMDEDFVIVKVWELVGEQLQRRTWIFTRRTQSYTNAYGSFKEPSTGPAIMIYQQMDRVLHLIHEYRSFNIRISLPYLTNTPISSQKAGQTESYLIKATSSTGNEGQIMQCRLTLNFLYIENTNTSIIKTGLQGRNQTFVDAPDNAEYFLEYEFFGRNISYTVQTTNINTSSFQKPQSYVEKKLHAVLNFPPEIDQNFIVYYEMFGLNSYQEIEDKDQIFGLVQVAQSENNFPIYYIKCNVQLDAEFINPIVKCLKLSKINLSNGKIKEMSQMYSLKQRFAAIVFVGDETTLYLYYFDTHEIIYYGHKKFGYDYNNMMTGVEVTAKMQVIITFEFGKRLEVYKLQDLGNDQEKPALPLFTINAQVMRFFGIQYFSPVKTKLSIYHDEVTFIQTKTGVIALNINELGFPELLFHIRTLTSKYDFEVNRNTIVIVGETVMELHRLTVPLRRRNAPFLLQKFTSTFNLNQYDEINSDGLFYLIEKQDNMLLVVHPNMPSTSVIYTEFFIGNIKSIDAVKLNDKEVLFVYNGTKMLTYLFAQNPRLRIRWQPGQTNFTMDVSAYNQGSKSESYKTLFSIIDSNEAFINTTEKFNLTEIRQSGYVAAKRNNKIITNLNITLNDSEWFTGNVMHYYAKCPHCSPVNESSNNFSVTLQNHLKMLNTQIKVGEPVYDMKSTYNGVFGQMYDSIFKTFPGNDNIEYIKKIPTTSRGEVCSKLAVNTAQDYVLSFCEGKRVNIYITTQASKTPKTIGPFPTEAEAVNHVEVVNNLIMIVDNDDDPFNRAGGVYIYSVDINAVDPADVLTMLDFIDNADLQIEGFRGLPFIASADFHKPLFNKDEYAIFLTEARTGSIFVILFELSTNKQQLVYLHKRLLDLNRLIPPSARHPLPLRVTSINIVDYTVRTVTKFKIEYVILLTVKNWHHVQLMLSFDQDYDLLTFQVSRLFERVSYPWELTNYIRLRKGSLNASYFAVSYRNYVDSAQLIVVYEIPYFRLPDGPEEEEVYNKNKVNGINPSIPQTGIPLTPVLAAHRVLDTAEMSFQFNTKDEHRLIFNDVATVYLNELQLNKQLKLIIRNADPTKDQGQNITIIAENHYTNVTFMVEFKFNFDKDDDDKKNQQTQIIWIIILAVGFVVIVGLIFLWSKQSKDPVNRDSAAIKESLLTVEPEFKSNFINRSSVDPESVRGTIQYTPAQETKMRKEVIEYEQKEDKREQQGEEEEEELQQKPSQPVEPKA